MKILGVSASPRKKESQTLLLLNEALLATQKLGASTELVDLPDLKIEFCLACGHCHKKKGCVINDDVFVLLDKFLASDGFILASPVYIRQVTASLKAVMDRSTHFIHCQKLLGKYAGCVVTSGSGRGQEVLDYIRDYVVTCGAQYVGGISSEVPLTESVKEEARIFAQRLVEAIKMRKEYPEQLKEMGNFRKFFKDVIQARKNEWEAEFRYWQKQGWI